MLQQSTINSVYLFVDDVASLEKHLTAGNHNFTKISSTLDKVCFSYAEKLKASTGRSPIAANRHLNIDIKAAFDNLQHRAILKSLDVSACPVSINRLFHSLLQNRKVTLLTPQGQHINKQGEKSIKMQQNLKRIAGGNWGTSQIHKWTLYKTVIERMLAHGSSAWCLNPTFKMKRKLSSIQRPFLHHISGAYRTTPTAALQTILGIPPTHAITVRSQVYINPSRNPSSPYHYRYPTARSGDEGNRLVHSSFKASQTKPNLFLRRRSIYSPKRHYKYFHRWLENQTRSWSCLLRLDQ
ncbi:hypothetical protein AVEN_72115-1 [Araneus ventricosus]|uniref:Reverse transcriptase domain-containing protein n=1 Tax=Araneus ventricosus TaxID=182803 RepID=A0A4Y2J1E2_ARAVE|nr:hypothetical protein AVEN_72115-1 [Araneus ventricosus]